MKHHTNSVSAKTFMVSYWKQSVLGLVIDWEDAETLKPKIAWMIM